MDGIYLVWNFLVMVSVAVLVIAAVIHLARQRLAKQEQHNGKED